MKIINKLTLLVSIVLALFSCTHNFEEINTNPNEPDRIDQPKLLLAGVIKNLSKVNTWKSSGAVLGDYYVDQFTSMFNDAFNNTSTHEFYYDGRNVQDMINLAEELEQPHVLGMGLVIKSFMYQQMTDAYGDFPYSEALSGKTQGVFTPRYDTQEDIYAALLNQLDRANELLSRKSIEDIGAYDNLYGGDLLKWRKFANSLKLRLLMRASGKMEVGTKITEMLNQPDTYPLMTGNDDNAVFSYSDDQQSNWSPLYTASNEK